MIATRHAKMNAITLLQLIMYCQSPSGIVAFVYLHNRKQLISSPGWNVEGVQTLCGTNRQQHITISQLWIESSRRYSRPNEEYIVLFTYVRKKSGKFFIHKRGNWRNSFLW